MAVRAQDDSNKISYLRPVSFADRQEENFSLASDSQHEDVHEYVQGQVAYITI